jgi:hypothetical protein
MYNPQPDRSAEILTNANNQAASIQFQGMQNLGDSIAAMGESTAKAYQQASDNKMTSDYLDAMADQYSKTLRQDGKTPYMDAETLAKFSKAPLGRKQGIITSIAAQQEYDHKQWLINTQMSRVNAQMLSMQPAPNQQPYTGAPTATPTVGQAQPQANPAGGINMNFVTQPQQQP